MSHQEISYRRMKRQTDQARRHRHRPLQEDRVEQRLRSPGCRHLQLRLQSRQIFDHLYPLQVLHIQQSELEEQESSDPRLVSGC